MTVFDSLIGQPEVVELLTAAATAAAAVVEGQPGPGMTHAWLFTGPPGSGRSVAARAFAAALQCRRGGCGQGHEGPTPLTRAHAAVAGVEPARPPSRGGGD